MHTVRHRFINEWITPASGPSAVGGMLAKSSLVHGKRFHTAAGHSAYMESGVSNAPADGTEAESVALTGDVLRDDSQTTFVMQPSVSLRRVFQSRRKRHFSIIG